MSCHVAIRLICDYLEGRLSPPVERQVSEHIIACQNCFTVLEAAEETLEKYFGDDPSRLPHPHMA
jgi:anti-sigma factor RsiW